MRFQKIIFILFVIVLSVNNLFAGTASSKLSALADSLISGYSDKFKDKKSAIAIFPLNCDEKLDKLRVGFAVSEIMSHRFVASNTFTVVERGELNKLLSEQKLQASGAVESESAVRLGKILGADVILVGNVQKVGGNYQVNARLVNAETSEVVSSGYQEFDASAFEYDAKVYLNLVPEKEAVGISVLYHSRLGSETSPKYQLPVSMNFTPESFSPSGIGVMVSYKPSKNIIANMSMVVLGMTKIATVQGPGVGHNHRLGGQLIELDVDWMNKFHGSAFSYSIGVGGTIPGLKWVGYAIDEVKTVKSFYPSMVAGISYRRQGRFSVSLRLKQDLQKISVTNQFGDTIVAFPSLSVEPAISLYF